MVKARIKKAVATLAYGLGLTRVSTRLADFWVLRRGDYFFSVSPRRDETFLILLYHRVNERRNRFAIETIPTPLFDRQMHYVARHWDVLSLEEVVCRLRSGDRLPKRCVVITFDDGYEDNYLHAFPILQKYDLPATIFLTAGCMDTGESLWFDRVLHAFEQTSRHSVDLPQAKLRLSFQTPAEKYEAAIRTLYGLMALPGSTRLSQVDALCDQFRVEGSKALSNQMLNWSQVREMAREGISFGSHTLTHPILSQISLEEAEWEVTESKRLMESRIGRPVHTFAYPSGRPDDYSPEIMDLIKKAGYDAALTTIVGANSRRGDVYQLKRIRPWGQDLPSLALSMTLYHFIPERGMR